MSDYPSGGLILLIAYQSGDPYLAFAKMAGAVPDEATKQSHPKERASYKECMLATQYGMGAKSLASKLGQPEAFAQNLLQRHRDAFPAFWKWVQQRVDTANLHGSISTAFGWTIQTTGEDNPRSLANFTMQANGAEMMRLACCFATEDGINVCCPVHDAIMVEASASEIYEVVERTRAHMAEAARLVTYGLELETDADIVIFPNRYRPEKGTEMWERVNRIIKSSI